MNITNLLKFEQRECFRNWFEKNAASEKDCWVALSRGKPKKDGILCYIDALEEALCFGWIDTTLKKLPPFFGGYAQRFMPRRLNGHWTELNKERCRRLVKLGLMTDLGLRVAPNLDEAFKADEDIILELKKDAVVWNNFLKFPPLYRRIRLDNIQSYRKQEEIFKRRLNKLIETSKLGIMYGNWNDYGRLEDY